MNDGARDLLGPRDIMLGPVEEAGSMKGGTSYEADEAGTRTLETLEGAERYNRWLFSWIEPYLGEMNVEIGAGQGTLTRFALEKRRVLATEPSETGRAMIRRRYGANSHLLGIVDNFLDVPAEASVDCIYSANVLEHVPDDVLILEHAGRMLRPGGRFVAVVPAGAWLYSRFDALVGHYRRYTSADRVRLEVMLAERKIPLTLTDFVYRNPVGALGWFVGMRMLARDHIARSQVKAVERLVPVMRALDVISPPFGQSLLLRFSRTY